MVKIVRGCFEVTFKKVRFKYALIYLCMASLCWLEGWEVLAAKNV